MPYKNIEDRKKYEKKYYQKNKDKIKRYHNVHSKKKYKELKEWYDDYKKNLKCKICGENDYRCLDFHHIDPKLKRYEVVVAVKRRYSKKNIIEEIKKCRVLCANCHRKIHYKG